MAITCTIFDDPAMYFRRGLSRRPEFVPVMRTKYLCNWIKFEWRCHEREALYTIDGSAKALNVRDPPCMEACIDSLKRIRTTRRNLRRS